MWEDLEENDETNDEAHRFEENKDVNPIQTLSSSYHALPEQLRFDREGRVIDGVDVYKSIKEFLISKSSTFVRFEPLTTSSFSSGPYFSHLKFFLDNGILEETITNSVVLIISKKSNAIFVILNNYVGKSNLVIASSFLNQVTDLSELSTHLSSKQMEENQFKGLKEESPVTARVKQKGDEVIPEKRGKKTKRKKIEEIQKKDRRNRNKLTETEKIRYIDDLNQQIKHLNHEYISIYADSETKIQKILEKLEWLSTKLETDFPSLQSDSSGSSDSDYSGSDDSD